MHVADFESGSFAAQAARAKRRKTAFMRNFRQRVGLIHKLGQLTAAEEFTDGSHHRLGIDQVVRHGGSHFLVYRHLFLDRPLHPHQSDTELVFEQFTYGAHPAVAQVVDVIHASDVFGQLERVFDNLIEIFRGKCAMLQRRIQSQLDIEFEPAHFRKVVFAGIIEHAFEKRGCGFQSGRISRPLLPIDFDQGIRLGLDVILIQGLGNSGSRVFPLREKHFERIYVRLAERCQWSATLLLNWTR